MDVHPLADIFPMMGDDELAELADDIKENGLLHPIVVDADGVLIDGRNRLRACEIAGVEPQFTQLNGHDASAFIVSANLARRNLTKAQQAMATAIIYPEADQRGRGNKGKAELSSAFSQKRLAQARSVLRHSRALANEVLAGRKPLNDAVKQVGDEQNASMTAGEQLATLRAMAPDLADLVEEERMVLAEAWAAWEQRKEKAAKLEANQRENLIRLTQDAWNGITSWGTDTFIASLHARLADETFRAELLKRVRVDPDLIRQIQTGAEALTTFCEAVTREDDDV